MERELYILNKILLDDVRVDGCRDGRRRRKPAAGLGNFKMKFNYNPYGSYDAKIMDKISIRKVNLKPLKINLVIVQL